MVTIIVGTTNKPTASDLLSAFFKKNVDMTGYMYIGYPIIGTVDGAYPIDALWISPEKGAIAFRPCLKNDKSALKRQNNNGGKVNKG